MYKLMIVDDDELVRGRIRTALPIERLGLALCGEAKTGPEALELFEQMQPHVIIMDISIPLINGIEVAKKILSESRDVGIIIITGYGSVDFAREAIKSGMADFLLKPIDFSEMEAAIQKITKSMDEKYAHYLERQRMERLLKESMPLLRERYFMALMTGSLSRPTEQNCRSELMDFGVRVDVSRVCAIIISPRYRDMAMNERIPIQAVLEKELAETMKDIGVDCLTFFDSLQRAIVVVYGNIENLNFRVERKLSLLRDKMRYLLHFDFQASIGSVVEDFCRLGESYQSAQTASSYSNVFGENNIVNIENVTIVEPVRKEKLRFEHSRMINLLIDADSGKLQDSFRDYFSRAYMIALGNDRYIRQKTIELLSQLVSCAQEVGAETDSVYTDSQDPYITIMLSSDLHQSQRYIAEIAEQILQSIRRRREDKNIRAVDEAKLYIRRNLHNPELNLTMVSENVGFTPAYISQLFTKSEGHSFTDYLNFVRIERAKQLLLSTHMRVYEIAEAVGYQNPKYFFQVFKQLTGKRPREYYKDAGVIDESK